MQAHKYEGYVENGQFYPQATLAKHEGRYKAVLTVLEVPAEKPSTDWVDELMRMIEEDDTEDLRMEDFPRFDIGLRRFIVGEIA